MASSLRLTNRWISIRKQSAAYHEHFNVSSINVSPDGVWFGRSLGRIDDRTLTL